MKALGFLAFALSAILVACGRDDGVRPIPFDRKAAPLGVLSNWNVSFNNVKTAGRDTVEISAVEGFGPGRREFRVSIVRRVGPEVILIGAEFSGWPGLPDTTVLIAGAGNPEVEVAPVVVDSRFYAGRQILFYNDGGACPGSFTYAYPFEVRLGRHVLRATIGCADWVCYGVPIHFETHGVSVDGIPIPSVTDDVRNFPLSLP